MEVSRRCESAEGAAGAASAAGVAGAAGAAGTTGVAGAAWLLKGSSWPERSEGHERSPAGVYLFVFDQGEVSCPLWTKSDLLTLPRR